MGNHLKSAEPVAEVIMCIAEGCIRITVYECQVGMLIGLKDYLRQKINHILEPVLAFPDRLFRFLALRDIPKYGLYGNYLPVPSDGDGA